MKKLSFLILTLFIGYCFNVSGQTLLTGIEEYYKFDEASGSTQLIDATGTVSSSSVSATVGSTGKIGMCYSFNGTSNKVTFGDHANWTINTTDNLSISAWINFSGDIAYEWGNIFGTTSYYSFQVRKKGTLSYSLIWYGGGAGVAESSSFTVTAGTWYHVVMTKSGSAEVKFYLNNNLLSTVTPGDVNKDPGANYIGGNDGSTEYFNGKIDELGIWGKVLTTTEISSLYNSGSGLTYPFSAVTVPSAPVATSATSPTSSSFTTNWGSVSGATGYYLDVSTSNSFASYVSGYNNLAVGNVITYSVTGLSPSTTYYYRVRANNSAGTSGNSNTITQATSAAATTYTITLTQTTGGTISASATTCAAGASITFTAAPNSGYQFSTWSGISSTSNPATVTVNSNLTVSAAFTVASTSWQTGTGGIYYSGGNVGIGTNTPTSNLHISSTSTSNAMLSRFERTVGGQTDLLGFYAFPVSEANTYMQRSFMLYGSGNDLKYLQISNAVADGVIRFTTGGWNSSAYERMTILGNGNIGIGCPDPQVKLAVNGTIKALRIDVVTAPCADYVFNHDYKLMSLTDLDKFIKANKHLPEVPSATEFKATGYSVHEMDELLLKKVGELTLYIIELKKEMDVLKTKK